METNKEPVEETKVGIMSALGYSRKEISAETGKSFHTVNEHMRRLFDKNNLKSTVDLTRVLVKRYTGIDVDEILEGKLNDLIKLFILGLGLWMFINPEIIDTLKTSLVHFFNKP
jgi:hypothetical protein